MWALQFTCIKLVQDQAGPFFTVWGPMTLATLLLILWMRRQRRGGRPGSRRTRRDIPLFFVLAAAGVFPGQFFLTWGTRLSLAGNGALLMLALPVCTALMARLFLGERMSGIRWISFVLALAGVLLCSGIDFAKLDFGATYLGGQPAHLSPAQQQRLL